MASDSAALKPLKTAFNQHLEKFQKIYLPIRHKIYAHRLMTDQQAAADLFPLTNREELGRTVDFIYELVHLIQDLHDNGNEPVFGRLSLADHSAQARKSVEKILRKLVKENRAANGT